MNIESAFTSVFGFLHSVTAFVRDTVFKYVPDYATLIIIALALVGGYFLDQKKPTLTSGKVLFVNTTVLWYALIIFLILKFI